MGRVARYKKIKDVDPYSKKNGGRVDLGTVGIWGLGENGRKAKKRSRRSEQLRSSRTKGRRSEDEGFDLPPSGKRDEFDINDLVGSIKKQKMVNPLRDDAPTAKEDLLFAADKVKVGGNIATIPKDDHDEKKAARILNVQSQVQKEVAKTEAKKHARMEGESKNAFNKRTRAETRQIIKQTSETKNPEKKLKKKEFLNKKKHKKRGGATDSDGNFANYDNGYDDQDTLITGERAIAMVDEVRFGEQAERPPVFRQLPRGAKIKSYSSKQEQSDKTTGMTDDDVMAESRAMEMMRRKIQAQYNAVKLKRRRAGDFHL
jgi:hypothetical protein